MNEGITNSRREFTAGQLNENDLLRDPLAMFAQWLNEAVKKHVREANAFTLSTVNKNSEPTSRILLLRGLDERGLSFYTNYNSQKVNDIIGNNKVAMNFFWPVLERQVRVQGVVSKLADHESDVYFSGRPRESQISAWASPQSQVIANKKDLVEKFADVEKNAGDSRIPRPKHWGGLIVIPHYYEFWQGGPHRLHDRFRYSKKESEWLIERLAP
jgi:pyridoxamine 5'-phosphate oxidase